MSNTPQLASRPLDNPKTPPSKDKTTPRPTHTRNLSNPNFPSHSRLHHRRNQSQSQSHSTISTLKVLDPTLILDQEDENSPLHFSPSKARAAAQQSQQLAILKRWLTSLLPLPESALSDHVQYHSQHPLIVKWETEHRALSMTNPDLAAEMVRWLQETMYVNRTADERGRLVYEAKVEELERLRGNERYSRGSGPDEDENVEGSHVKSSVSDQLIRELRASLSNQSQDALDSLAETGVSLGYITDLKGSSQLGTELGRAVIEYTLQTQDLQSHIERLQHLKRVMEKRLEQAQAQLEVFNEEKSAATKASEVMHPQTAQWNREMKQINMKINEYKDRVAALERSRPGLEGAKGVEQSMVRIEDVVEKQNRVNERKTAVRKLEKTLQSLNGLPPDLEASRNEVKRAKMQLETLQAQRQELFAELAGR